MAENKDINNDKGGEKIKFKAEPTRHFPRYKIPASAEIEGKKYTIKDWSIDGCAIENLPEQYLEKKWITGNFIVPFDTFDAVIKDIKIEFLRKNEDGSIGCRFTSLKPEQISLMQDVIEAYLEGTIVTINEFINVIKREDLRESLELRQPKQKTRGNIEETLRKLFIVSLFVIIIATLLLFILDALYNRVYLVRAVSAFYDAPLKVVRTPASGFFSFKAHLHEGERVKKKQILGFVNVPGGVSFIVPAPSNGVIETIYAYNDVALKEGDPILTILPNNSKIYILANILHKDLRRVKIGQNAKITRFDGKVIRGKIADVEAIPSLAMLHSTSPMPSYSLAWNYDRIVISINQNKTSFHDIGKSVKVEIDLSPKILKPVFKIFDSN